MRYDLTPLLLAPVAADGIGNVTHSHPNKRKRPWEPKWEEDFGLAAAKYPVVATEFGGFAAPGTPGDSVQAQYGSAIINYLESRGISWMVWCFDPERGPTLIREYQLTLSGEVARQAFRR